MTETEFNELKKRVTMRAFYWSPTEANNLIVHNISIHELSVVFELAEQSFKKEPVFTPKHREDL